MVFTLQLISGLFQNIVRNPIESIVFLIKIISIKQHICCQNLVLYLLMAIMISLRFIFLGRGCVNPFLRYHHKIIMPTLYHLPFGLHLISLVILLINPIFFSFRPLAPIQQIFLDTAVHLSDQDIYDIYKEVEGSKENETVAEDHSDVYGKFLNFDKGDEAVTHKKEEEFIIKFNAVSAFTVKGLIVQLISKHSH